MELPSAGDLTDAADVLLGLAEIDFEQLTLPEVMRAYKVFCNHPVVWFARRACDLLEVRE